ncbi:MAG: ABC transporter substrate-binding protein [Desulfuromonadales bacterium]|nr:ABC transporter substrate-binding protein [Desulfuromonadales bacterium]
MMMKRKRFLPLVLLITFMVILISSQVMAGKKDDTLNVALMKEVTHVDKYFNTTREGMITQRLAWDSLLYFDSFENKIKPALATSYNWVDGLTLDFTLRQGVQFHDGSSFEAEDVAYTFNYIADPENKVPSKRFTKWIKNAEVLSPYKVRMHLKKPWPSALQYLAGPLHINPKGAWDRGVDYQNRHPIGTGPYKIVNNALGEKIVLEKNEHYYKDSPKGQPSIGKIVLNIVPDFNTQIAGLMNGSLDWTFNVPTDMIDSLQGNSKIQTMSGDSMRVAFLMMDSTGRANPDSPLNKLKVRRAVAHAIDREAIVKFLVKGSSKVAHSACNPVQLGCTEDVRRYPYDPKKAKQLLTEAGYSDGFKTKMYAYRDFGITEAVVAYLDAVGIKAQLFKGKSSVARSAWRKGEDVPFAHWTWGSSSLADISAFTPNFFNLGQDDLVHDEEIAAWMAAGDSSTDPAVRTKSYNKAIKKIAEKSYWVPLYVYSLNYVMSNDLDSPASPDGLPRLFNGRWK